MLLFINHLNKLINFIILKPFKNLILFIIKYFQKNNCLSINKLSTLENNLDFKIILKN